MKQKKLFGKIRLLFILLLGMIFIDSCGIYDVCDETDHYEAKHTNYSVSEPFSYSLPAANNNTFYLVGINGSVDITGVSDDSLVSITGERIVKSDSYRDAEIHMDFLHVEVTQDDSVIRVKTEQPEESHGRNYIVNYTVRIPDDWVVETKNVNGNVIVTAINNQVSVNLVNGAIHCNHIQGSMEGRLVNGEILVDVCLPENGNVVLTSVNGPIDLFIQQDISAVLSANVVNGAIQIIGLDLDNITQTKTSICGSLGDGEGQIILKTVNGSIQVHGTK